MHEVTKAEIALTLTFALVSGVGVGMFAQDQLDEKRSAAAARTVSIERDRERQIWADKETRLNRIIDSERKRHDEYIRGRDAHLAAFSARSVRLRNQLETLLADSRAANDACSGRIAGITEDVADLDGLLDQSAELLEAGQSQIKRLEAENRKLGQQIDGLIGQYRAEHPERITVTGSKR